MDAMVTARMPKGKKDAGNAILRQLGMSASQVINELYDYIILERATPFGNLEVELNKQALSEAYEYVDGLPAIELEHNYLHMDARDARRERLTHMVGNDTEESR